MKDAPNPAGTGVMLAAPKSVSHASRARLPLALGESGAGP